MAIYHCSIKIISRGKGKSAVASEAYRSGEKLYDDELGQTFDYTRKRGVEFAEIILCKNAPKEYQDRSTLWNAVERIEKVSNAQLAREWEVAIPKELSLEQGQELVRHFAQSLADEGMCVDFAIHDKGDGNRHAHIMGTTRPIKENGQWGAKEKKAYKLDEHGEKIPVIDPTTGNQKIGAQGRKMWQRETVASNDWNRKDKVYEWRERWAKECNRYLDISNQIDHRSYKEQNVDQVPTIHEGYAARQIEQKGRLSYLCQINRDRKAYNNLLQTVKELIDNYVRGAIRQLEGDQRVDGYSRGSAEGECRTDERELGSENVRKIIDRRKREITEFEQHIEYRKPIISQFIYGFKRQADRIREQIDGAVQQLNERTASNYRETLSSGRAEQHRMTKEEIRGKIEKAQQTAADLHRKTGNRIEIWYNAENDDIKFYECAGNTYMVSNAPYMFELSSSDWWDIYGYKKTHGLPVEEDEEKDRTPKQPKQRPTRGFPR